MQGRRERVRGTNIPYFLGTIHCYILAVQGRDKSERRPCNEATSMLVVSIDPLWRHNGDAQPGNGKRYAMAHKTVHCQSSILERRQGLFSLAYNLQSPPFFLLLPERNRIKPIFRQSYFPPRVRKRGRQERKGKIESENIIFVSLTFHSRVIFLPVVLCCFLHWSYLVPRPNGPKKAKRNISLSRVNMEKRKRPWQNIYFPSPPFCETAQISLYSFVSAW